MNAIGVEKRRCNQTIELLPRQDGFGIEDVLGFNDGAAKALPGRENRHAD